MDIQDAIIRSIIGGNYRYGIIFSRANEITHMSRETFNKHLRNLVKDKWIIKTDKGKQKIEYRVNQESFDVFKKFQKEDSEKKVQKTIKKLLNSKIDFSVISTKKKDKMIKYFDELMHTILEQQKLSNLIIHILNEEDSTIKNKAIEGIKRNDKTIDLILKLIQKIDQETWNMYFSIMLIRFYEESEIVLDTKMISMIEELTKK